MSQTKFIGCLHFRHHFVATKIRGFKNMYEHDDFLIRSYNEVVNKNDLVYILGDITMETPKHYYLLDELNGKKKVILGNHDRGRDIPELLKYVDEVTGMLKYKKYWITHAPVHPQELSFVKGNIHAHVHEQHVVSSKVKVDYWDCKKEITSSHGNLYYNTDAHYLGYKPKTIEELIKYNINKDS